MAMKLHFKNGAIVRFSLTCEARINACGKVVEVTDDEVVFIPQSYVSEYDYDESCGTTQLNRNVSVDNFPEIHLDRSIIAMWHYESVPCESRTTYYGVWKPSQIVTMDVNYYDEDGLCRGQGEFFE